MSVTVAHYSRRRQKAGWDFQMDLDLSGAINVADQQRENNEIGVSHGPCPKVLDRYIYDGLGNMVKRTHYAAGVTTSTTYIDGIYEKTSAGVVTKYYSAFGRRVAMRVGTGPLSYFIADQLGATTGIIDGATGTIARQSYWPFGATRSTTGALGTDKQYTGQQAEAGDAALGLYNYNARFYSTTLGRFASADSLTVDGLNRYTYVKSNPLRHVDSTGHCVGGPEAECTPSIALNLLACAQSVEACNAVFTALGREASLNDIRLAHEFASVAVGTHEFWGNFFRPDINPYFNGARLLSAYQAHPGFDPFSSLFAYGNLTFNKYFPTTGAKKFDAAFDLLARGTNAIRDTYNSQIVQCGIQIGMVIAPWAAVVAGPVIFVVSDGELTREAIYISVWGANGIAAQAYFTNGGPTFDKC